MNWLALLARYLWTFRQRDDCKAALERYRAVKASGGSPAEVERAWLAIPLFCEGRPDRP